MHDDPRERLQSEFDSVALGDERLNRRAARIAERVLDSPGASFPSTFKSEAELEGLYRFANNDRVDHEVLMAPHVAKTRELVAKAEPAVILHDSTECRFTGEVPREGLGFLGRDPGFLLHVALAVSGEPDGRPLGVLGLMPIVRTRPQDATTKLHSRARARKKCKESNRWCALVERVESQARPGATMIHVMDREADIYRVLESMTQRSRRFVVRAYVDRKTKDDDGLGTILSSVATAEDVLEREIVVSARNNDNKMRYSLAFPSRSQRRARLAVRAKVVTICSPTYTSKESALRVGVVQVHEVEAPPDEPPVEWTLLTSEPVTTPAEVGRVVDYYRARWRIEEYFKALKTGCSFEKRQFESLDALLRILGLLAPIAWQLLALRSVAHSAPQTPASEMLTEAQIQLLRAKAKLPEQATVADALLAIAKLGGHLRRNGPPGWQTLGRGLETLLQYEVGWIAAQAEM